MSVTYTWTFLTPLVGAFFPGGKVDLRVDSAMKNEGVSNDEIILSERQRPEHHRIRVVMPLICVLALGVAEMGWALLDAHIVTRLAREGSNLISRDTSLQDAASAMQGMATRPVDFNTGSKVIFSVIRNVATIGAANYNKPVLYQRYEYGSFPASSKLTIAGSGSFGPAPEYQALNSDSNTGLQVTNLPPASGDDARRNGLRDRNLQSAHVDYAL